MNKEIFKDIIDEFNNISKLGWIKGEKKGHGSIGLTFERELHKNPDSNFFPDKDNIEIKCTTRFSNYPITLFSSAFDGPTFPEINRIVDLYGYKDYQFKDKKVIHVDLNSLIPNKVGNYKFKLFMDSEKLYLEVFDLFDTLIERKSFVYLDTLLDHLNVKLSNLVIIRASKKKIDNDEYYRYYKLSAYTLKKNKFISLLDSGKIIVTLDSRIGRSGRFYGLYKNKNLVFKIDKKYISELFEEVCCIDNDYRRNYWVSNTYNGFYIMK